MPGCSKDSLLRSSRRLLLLRIGGSPVPFTLLVLCLLSSWSRAQSSREPGEARASDHRVNDTRFTVLTGRVLFPDGTPVCAASVSSSTGESTLSEPDGSFWLELELSPATTQVQLTAAQASGTTNWLASVPVSIP